MRQAPDRRSYAAVGAMALLLGGSYLLTKIAVAEATPLQVAAMRTWIGAAGLFVMSKALGAKIPSDPVIWRWCAAIGVIGIVLPLLALAWAAPRLPSGVVGIFAAMIPLWVMPLAHFLTPILDIGERMSWQRVMGLGIGAMGALVLIGADTIGALGASDLDAQLAAFSASAMLAMTAILMRAMPRTDLVGAATLQILIASAVFAPVVLWTSAPVAFSTEVWSALLALGIGSSAIALLLRGFVNSTAGPVFMSITNYLIPVTAVLLGWGFGGEVLEWKDLFAGLLILLGVAVSRGAIGVVAKRLL